MLKRRYTIWSWSLLAAAPLLHGAAPGAAVDSEADAPRTPADHQLEVISVSATRSPLAAFDYPGMVSVIDREQIRLNQPSTVDDVLKWVPNVEFTGGPRRTGMDPSIRGFSGPDVIVTIDGVRQNFDSGHDGRFFVDPSLLREAEVLRGGASALYGSGGTGGVIALRTQRAEDLLADGETMGVSVGAGYRSVNDEQIGVITAYGKPHGRLDLLGSVTRRSSGTIELGDGSELDRNDDDIAAALGKMGWELGSGGQRVDIAYHRFDNDAQEPNNGQGTGDDNVVDKFVRTDGVSMNWQAPAAHPLLDARATVYYNRSQVDEVRLDDAGAGPAGERLERTVDTVGGRLENRSRLFSTDTSELSLTYGLEGWRDQQNGAAGAGERGGVPDARTRFIGGFAQAELRWEQPAGLPGEALFLPRVRVDHYDSEADDLELDNTDQATSTSVGLTYRPTSWLQTFGSYSEGFRAPATGELFQTGVHFQIPVGPGIVNRFIPNPDLEPQRTATWEFGAGLQFSGLLTDGDAFEIKASRFITDGNDFIDIEVDQPTPFVSCNPFVPAGCDGVTRATNIDDAELDGVEMEARYESRRFRMALGLSNVDGENEQTGEPLGVLTPRQWTVDAAWKPSPNARLGWRVIKAADFDDVTEPAEQREGYDVHDVYLSWSPASGLLAGSRLDLAAENLFDEAYARVFTDALQPGRNISVCLSYQLGR